MTAITTTPTTKKTRATSPTQRTLALLRSRGWVCEVVEKHISFKGGKKGFGFKRDAFGWMDILCMGEYGIPWWRTIGVQTTTGANHADRKAKILALESFRQWVDCGNVCLLITWRKILGKNKDGSRSKAPKWEPRIERLTLDDLDSLEGEAPQ